MLVRMSSKELLANSLLELSKSKSLSKITIKEISNYCLMTRESFYYHFTDRYELMIWIYENQIKKFVEEGILKDPIIVVWSKSLSIMKKYRYFYKEAFEDPIYIDLILNSFISNLRYCIKSHDATEELSDPDVQFAIRFYANGLLSMTIEWIKLGAKEDTEMLSKRMCAIMPSALIKYYIF